MKDIIEKEIVNIYLNKSERFYNNIDALFTFFRLKYKNKCEVIYSDRSESKYLIIEGAKIRFSHHKISSRDNSDFSVVKERVNVYISKRQYNEKLWMRVSENLRIKILCRTN